MIFQISDSKPPPFSSPFQDGGRVIKKGDAEEVREMGKYNIGSQTIYDIKYHFVWITKYRNKVLLGGVAVRLRELLRQGCESRGLEIIRGSISNDHVHMLLSCPATIATSDIMRYLKGRSSHLLQDEFPEIKKKILGTTYVGKGRFLRVQ